MTLFLPPEWTKARNVPHTGTSGLPPPAAAAMLDRGRLMGSLYHGMVEGTSLPDLLRDFCEGLATAFRLPLVVTGRKLDTGTISVAAHSGENRLWTELQRLPEHWDGTVAGNGPAAKAVLSGESAWMSVQEEGMLPWRKAAEQEQIVAAGAWPVRTDAETWVLELFASDAGFFQDEAIRRLMGHVSTDLGAFLREHTRYRECVLLSRALEQSGSPAFITTLEGDITWINRAFSRLYGYSIDEVRGHTPQLLSSGRQGLRYYRGLWDTIRAGQVWRGQTVDRDRDGNQHTVRQTISPFGSGDRVTHYLSVHEDISADVREQHQRDLLSETDPLTGLMTPAHLELAVAEAIAGDEQVVVLALSLRGFASALRPFPLELGEAMGGELNDRIRRQLAETGAACRLSPGEYLLTLRSTAAGESGLATFIQGLRQALAEPFPMLGGPLALTPRIGIARFPEHGATFAALSQHADHQLADHPASRAQRSLHRE